MPTKQTDDGDELRELISTTAQSFGTDPITKGTIWKSYLIPEGVMQRLIPALLAREREAYKKGYIDGQLGK